MLSLLNKLFGKPYNEDLKSILGSLSNQEELLGMKTPIIPTPEGIKIDASKIKAYTDSNGYKKFAEEAWSLVIQDLDKILDERTTKDQRDSYCGAVRRTLDLLRLSYKAQYVIEKWDEEHNTSLRQVKQG